MKEAKLREQLREIHLRRMLAGVISLAGIAAVIVGYIRYIDTSSKDVRTWFYKKQKEDDEKLKSLFISGRIDSISIDAGTSYVKPLVDFFKLREKRW